MLIDIDVHHAPNNFKEEWIPLIDEPYRSEVAKHGDRRIASGIRYEDGGSRWDVHAPDGRRGGFDPGWTAENLMDRYGHRYALLTGFAPFAGVPDPDYQAAICRAFNDHTLKYWLPVDDRYLAGIHVPAIDPQLAAREIERLGSHPRVKAALIAGSTHRIPLGNRFYWPIYEACQRHNLPIHLHPSTVNVMASASTLPTGMATNYLQSHTAQPLFFMSDLISLVLEGTFEKFPGLKVLFAEGGICWLPHVLWRMDKEYKGLRQEAPFLRRLPSEYVRDHCRFGTQPIEEPKKAEHLVQIFNMVDADHIVMYASDYPHWDFDEPSVLPKQLGATTLRRILHDNACEFFGLPPMPVEQAITVERGVA